MLNGHDFLIISCDMAYSPSYRNNPKYRSFDDDDDEYDYVDDYDEIGRASCRERV